MKLKSLAATTIAAAVMLPAFAAVPAFAAPDTTVKGSQPADLIITKVATPRGSAGNGRIWDTTGHNPIEGVEFTVQRLTDIDLTTNAGWQAAGTMTVAGTQGQDKDAAVVVTTAADGVAKFDNLPVGMYLVTETGTPAGVVRSDPFLVTLPLTDPTDTTKWLEYTDGAATNYVVNVYPKNDTVSLTKAVNDADDYKAGDIVAWTIDAKIPDMNGTGGQQITDYVITDQLDSRLTYDSLSIAGYTPVTDYTVTPAAGVGTDLVTITFTQTGRDKLEANSNLGAGRVVVTLNTKVNTGAVGIIPNTADLLVNSTDPADKVSSNTVNTIWANLKLTKVAQTSNSKLAGAVFELGYFTDPAAKTGWTAIDTQTTIADGTATFNTIRVEDYENGATDLTPREYFLMETQAPAGYQLLAERIPVDLLAGAQTPGGVTIDQGNIVNVPTIQLPLTGGMGGAALVLLPLVVAAGAFVAIVVVRRRRLAAEA